MFIFTEAVSIEDMVVLALCYLEAQDLIEHNAAKFRREHFRPIILTCRGKYL